MQTGEYSNLIKNNLKLMGFDLFNKIKIKGKLLLFICIYFTINNVIKMIKDWDNFHVRFLILGDLNVNLAFSGIFSEYALKSNNMQTVLSIMEHDFFDNFTKNNNNVTDKLSQDKKCIMEKCILNEKQCSKNVSIALKICIINIIVIKLIIRYLLLIYKNNYNTLNDLPLITEYIYPFNYISIEMYLFILTIQFICILTLHPLGICVFTSGVISMNKIGTEIKLLIVSFKELDNKFKSINYFDNSKNNELKRYTENLICHHLYIIRRVNELNKSLQIIASIVNQGACSIVCVNLYYFIEVTDGVLKLKSISTIFVVLSLLFLYTSKGQDIINEGENLRMMLWSCSWTAKPAWFKKFLLIIMISANKPLIVKPFGLYNLNLQNYSKVVNSAFSFYNLMKSLKKN